LVKKTSSHFTYGSLDQASRSIRHSSDQVLTGWSVSSNTLAAAWECMA
jgi:hypothetical protein